MPEKLTVQLTAHRGLATWGERLVPLATFRQAAAEAGLTQTPEEREAVLRTYRAPVCDPTPVEGPYSRLSLIHI